jgi:hypothetical protein
MLVVVGSTAVPPGVSIFKVIMDYCDLFDRTCEGQGLSRGAAIAMQRRQQRHYPMRQFHQR